MKKLILQNTSLLEQNLIALHTGNETAKKWFSQSLQEVLESNVDSYSKCDVIADIFTSIDSKLSYIKDQQDLLSNLKKQLELAKNHAKEEVSTLLSSYGLSKLEGLKVSSITVSEESNKHVPKLEIYNKDELLKLGFFTVILDEKAVEKALLSADTRPEVQEYADIKLEIQKKSATIRINKRKSLTYDETSHLAA